MCRYVNRPPLAYGRLQPLDPEGISFALQSPWDYGTTHVVFSPRELLGMKRRHTRRPGNARSTRSFDVQGRCRHGGGPAASAPCAGAEVWLCSDQLIHLLYHLCQILRGRPAQAHAEEQPHSPVRTPALPVEFQEALLRLHGADQHDIGVGGQGF